jgi:hypothetical protein
MITKKQLIFISLSNKCSSSLHLYSFSPSLSHSLAPTAIHTHTLKPTHTQKKTCIHPSIVKTSLQAGHVTENQFWFCLWDQLNKEKIEIETRSLQNDSVCITYKSWTFCTEC